jgi:hypothetical protein
VIRLILSLFIIIGTFTDAALAIGRVSSTRSGGPNAYIAAGVNFVIPGSVRIGWNSWEFGMLASDFYGASEHFPIGEHTYSSFGLGVGTGITPNLGMQAAVGFNWNMFMNIGLRGELMANAVFNGASIAHGLLGVSYGF